jgi:hypothetical protein
MRFSKRFIVSRRVRIGGAALLLITAGIDLARGIYLRAAVVSIAALAIAGLAMAPRKSEPLSAWCQVRKEGWRPSLAYLALAFAGGVGGSVFTVYLAGAMRSRFAAGRTWEGILAVVAVLAGAAFTLMGLISAVLGTTLLAGYRPRIARWWFPSARTGTNPAPNDSDETQDPRP